MQKEYNLVSIVNDNRKLELIQDAMSKNFDIRVLLNNDYSYRQMEQILLGFEHKLTKEQINIYAKPEFDWGKMEQIRLGWENNLTKEQIDTYAKHEFDWGKMEQIRLQFENDTINTISNYLNKLEQKDMTGNNKKTRKKN